MFRWTTLGSSSTEEIAVFQLRGEVAWTWVLGQLSFFQGNYDRILHNCLFSMSSVEPESPSTGAEDLSPEPLIRNIENRPDQCTQD